MKRKNTFKLVKVFPDYNVKTPKELENKIGSSFKLLGDIKVGSKLDLYFEDGVVFKTSPLVIEGYINEIDAEGNLKRVTMITKEMGYEFVLSDKKIKINLEEQLSLM